MIQMHTDTVIEELIAQQKCLEKHPVFKQVNSQQQLQIFMQWHVFAVWDFMSLVKRLQHDLSCTSIPWMPARYPLAAHLINEIVLGEESDETPDGDHISHFELYQRSMQEVAADTSQINDFIQNLQSGLSLEQSLRSASAPIAVQKFVSDTLHISQHGNLFEVLGYFFFGRENVIPGMFQHLLDEWKLSELDAPTFVYYLKRHIELDADTHGPAALQIIHQMTADNEQSLRYLQRGAQKAIQSRLHLWDELNKVLAASNDYGLRAAG